VIFLTVGTQLPFDRLVAAMDEVAPDLGEEVFAQIGNGAYQPRNFAHVARMAPEEFTERFQMARVVVGHAGIGTMLSGQQHGKPVVVMARRHALGEHRNDHQVATVAQLRRIPGVHVIETAKDLRDLLAEPEIVPMSKLQGPNLDRLVGRLRSEISAARP